MTLSSSCTPAHRYAASWSTDERAEPDFGACLLRRRSAVLRAFVERDARTNEVRRVPSAAGARAQGSGAVFPFGIDLHRGEFSDQRACAIGRCAVGPDVDFTR